MLAAHICRRSPRLLLPQDPDDLLLAKPTSLHLPSPLRDGLYPFLEEFSGLMSTASPAFSMAPSTWARARIAVRPCRYRSRSRVTKRPERSALEKGCDPRRETHPWSWE